MSLKRIAISFTMLTSLIFSGSCYSPTYSFTGQNFSALLSGKNEVPANNANSSGSVKFILSNDEKNAEVTISVSNLEGNFKYAYILGPAKNNENTTNVVFPMIGKLTGVTPLTTEQVVSLKAGLLYVNVYTEKYPGGEIRGQLK